MTLTNYTDYGLRALMLLAIDPEQVQSAAMLAIRLDVSRHHLAKILMDLVAGGYLLSSRGPAGGVRLAKPPGEIRIGDVVCYLERDQVMVECFRGDGGHCNLQPACRLRHTLSRAKTAFLEALNEKSLADMSLVPAKP
ncbi:RrF2 family transcriptional regulator [Acidiphilium sp.]|uniref:RrF2 family transcriptional regulator n=1 Tax=Acidiphilium sp. TaxID=527 RepID=UPI003CFBE059